MDISDLLHTLAISGSDINSSLNFFDVDSMVAKSKKNSVIWLKCQMTYG